MSEMENKTEATKKSERIDAILSVIAESPDPISPSAMQVKLDAAYSRVHEAFIEVHRQGLIQKATVKSKKNMPKTVYSLTFKGALKYLSTFTLTPNTLMDIFEFEKKEDEAKALLMIEKIGILLNYPLFKEIKWLYSRYSSVVAYFIDVSRGLLRGPLVGEAAKAEIVSRPNSKVPDAYFSYGGYLRRIEEDEAKELVKTLGSDPKRINQLRAEENAMLMFNFAEFFFINGVPYQGIDNSNIDFSNVALSSFAKEILKDNLWKIHALERAVKVFSGQKGADKTK